MSLLGLALVLLSPPMDASLTGQFDNSSGRMSDSPHLARVALISVPWNLQEALIWDQCS